MELEEYRALTARRGYIAAGSQAHLIMTEAAREAQLETAELNTGYHTAGQLRALFSRLTGEEADESFSLFPPFYTDFGKNIHIGKNVFINSGCCFQDQGGIVLGDGFLIGHQVVIATLNHDLDPKKRGGMYPAPVVLGKNVWVGAHATILAGVTIGDDSVIAAGAVVTKNVPAGVVAGGVPARVIRQLDGTRRETLL